VRKSWHGLAELEFAVAARAQRTRSYCEEAFRTGRDCRPRAGGCGRTPHPDRRRRSTPTGARRTGRARDGAGAYVRAVGLLVPKDEFRLSFKVGGVIDSVAVEAGDPVKRGSCSR